MYARFIYREIVAPERVAFVISFSDAAGGITRAPFPQLKDLWPLEVLHVATFSEQAGRTTVALRSRPINATEEERAMFAANTGSMGQGFGGAFDKLADFLGEACNQRGARDERARHGADPARPHHHPRVRCAARAGVEGVDRAGAREALVGDRVIIPRRMSRSTRVSAARGASASRYVETGRELWHGGVFREVVKPERLVFTFKWDKDGERGEENLVSITFAEEGGKEGRKTRMTFRQFAVRLASRSATATPKAGPAHSAASTTRWSH